MSKTWKFAMIAMTTANSSIGFRSGRVTRRNRCALRAVDAAASWSSSGTFCRLARKYSVQNPRPRHTSARTIVSSARVELRGCSAGRGRRRSASRRRARVVVRQELPDQPTRTAGASSGSRARACRSCSPSVPLSRSAIMKREEEHEHDRLDRVHGRVLDRPCQLGIARDPALVRKPTNSAESRIRPC